MYKVDRNSGEVVWRLGGKKSDFEMGTDVRTFLPHDARRNPDGTITIFDNRDVVRAEQSRGIVVEVDEDRMSASLVRSILTPTSYFRYSGQRAGIAERQRPGWRGSAPHFSEFDHHGKLLDAAYPAESESYRAFRFPWSGQPTDDPAIVVELGAEDEVTIYASWNGATEVTTWQVLAGSVQIN